MACNKSRLIWLRPAGQTVSLPEGESPPPPPRPPDQPTAALVSYPSLGCGNAASRYNMDNINYGYTLFSLVNSGTFFTNVLTELMSLFPGQYIHCGGDEVTATGDTQWMYCPGNRLIS